MNSEEVVDALTKMPERARCTRATSTRSTWSLTRLRNWSSATPTDLIEANDLLALRLGPPEVMAA